MSALEINLLLIITNFLIILSNGQICSKINIASNSSKVKNDMVKKGITNPRWRESTQSPILIGPSKINDYIYVIITDDSTVLKV